MIENVFLQHFCTTLIQDNANVTLTLGRNLPRPADNLAESLGSPGKILTWMGMSLLLVGISS